MIKKLTIIIMIINVLLLSSCSMLGRNTEIFRNSRTRMLDSSNDNEKADDRMKLVLEAINKKDKQNLISMYSSRALEEAQELDERIDFMFELFQNKINSIERTGQNVSESIHYGNTTKKVKTNFKIMVEDQEYIFILVEDTVDTENKDNIGLFTLRFFKLEDKEKYFMYWTDIPAGISIPEDYME